MSWFVRARNGGVPEHPVDDPDPGLPVLSRADAATVRRLAVERFAENGVETTIDGDALLAADGVFGLSNLAADVAATARRDWPDLVRRHVDALTADEERPADLDEVLDRLFLRLQRAVDLGAQLPAHAREVLPGIVEMVAIDHPTRVVELLRPDDIDRLGGVATVRDIGLANLRALPAPDHERFDTAVDRDDATVHVLHGEDFFGASRLLVLDELMRRLGLPVTPQGILVIVPNRHLLAVHLVSGDGVLSAMPVLLGLADSGFDGEAGALSPHLYYRPAPDAPFQQVTTFDEQGRPGVRLEGPLEDAFRALGLVEDG